MDGERDKSQKSCYDEVMDGVFTNYIELRSQIVSDKTVSILLDILNIPTLLSGNKWIRTLEKVGHCIAYSILYTGDERHFREIVSFVQKDSDVPWVKMKTYLEIIQIVLEAQPEVKQSAGQEAAQNTREQQRYKGLHSCLKGLSVQQFVEAISCF